MSSTTFNVRVDPVIKKRLEKLAKSTGRSRSFLAAEAINEYLELNEWQVAGIQKATTSFAEGRSVSLRQVKDWACWGNERGNAPLVFIVFPVISDLVVRWQDF
jgi:RHH-type rel operon transcriptional repressor/antitoxin RelB